MAEKTIKKVLREVESNGYPFTTVNQGYAEIIALVKEKIPKRMDSPGDIVNDRATIGYNFAIDKMNKAIDEMK